MSLWTWPAGTGGVTAVLEFWIGSMPVATFIGGVARKLHKAAERRHRESVAALLTANATRSEP